MRHPTLASIEPEFVRCAHAMVWCAMATVGPDGQPRTRVVHPLWRDGIGYIVTLRTGPKADDIDRSPYASLAYVSDPMAPAYTEVHAGWIDDRAERIALWEWIKTVPEPTGFDTEPMFGSYDYLTIPISR